MHLGLRRKLAKWEKRGSWRKPELADPQLSKEGSQGPHQKLVGSWIRPVFIQRIGGIAELVFQQEPHGGSCSSEPGYRSVLSSWRSIGRFEVDEVLLGIEQGA